MSTLAIIARVQLTEDSAPKYIEGAKKLIEPTLKEPGCEVYGMAVDIQDPTVVWISEQWTSQAHLDAHLKTPHIQEFIAYSSTLDVVSMDARQYAVSSVGDVVLPD
jgi:quinol monooxygenase YgiN